MCQWAGELFKAFRDNDTTREKELTKYLPPTTKHSLKSIKSVYKNRKKYGMTPFIAAILHNDMALCEQLIEEGIDFGQHGTAVIIDEEKFIQFNNDAGKQIDLGPKSNIFTDFHKTTPMFWAIKCDKLCLVEKLILKGHKMNMLVERLAGMPALSFAILSRNIPIVKHFLLNVSCDIHENSSLPGMKPLDVAIRSGNTDMVTLLLKHGETLDCVNHQLSPLLQAVFLKNLSMITLILSMGASINFGVETGKFFPPLNMAVLRGNFEIATFLIERGADVNVKDSIHCTALHLLLTHLKIQKENSINQSAFKLARLLLDRGARVDIANKTGDIPLLQAIILCEPKLVDLFLSTPINLNTLLITKQATFLHIAVSPLYMFDPWVLQDLNKTDYWKRRCSIVQSLIEKGADVNKQARDGRTSLHFAAESGCVKFVKLLLASKVDVNKLSENGKAALHYAAYNGSYKLVKLMLESGAEVNVKDIVGSTPLDFGIMENESFCYDTAELLIDYGADIYSHCVPNNVCPLKIYDVVVAMMRPDLLKLFWRQGYPYDSTLFLTKDCRVSVQSFFQSIGVENIISDDFKRRLRKTDCKQLDELINAQNSFINGVEKNSVKQVLNAIQKGAEVGGCSVNIPFPLHFLAKNGFTEVAQVLLSKGVKPNTVNSEGSIPADLAVEFGHFKMYQTLLQYGACYNRTGFDKTMFQKRGNGEHLELYLLIRQAFKSVKRGDHRILENLNKHVMLKELDIYHALVHCVDEKGRTLMALAVERDDRVIVQKLMEFRLQLFTETSALFQ